MGGILLVVMVAVCVGTLPWTLARVSVGAGDGAGQMVGAPLYNAGETRQHRLAPWWAGADEADRARLDGLVSEKDRRAIAARFGIAPEPVHERDTALAESADGAVRAAMRDAWPNRRAPVFFLLGSDEFGRSLLYRSLAGGGISLLIGVLAAVVSVAVGTLYGAIAAYAGGWVDGVMMRVVDVLYGLPYILLVVLLAIASDAVIDEYLSRGRARHAMAEARVEARLAREPGLEGDRAAIEAARAEAAREAAAAMPERSLSETQRLGLDVMTLVVAIGGVSWLTMARVVRGQVLSIKARPFMEAARALGVPARRQFVRHLLPNLVAPIAVYATLTVPQAILQESFLSFLGIGVKPPLPSWGNLAAAGLPEVNPYRSHWWLLLFPCLFLALSLVSLNVVGEALRERFDPRSRERGGA